MANCPKCSVSNPDGAKFCKACGTPVPQNDRKVRCSNGHIMDPSWKACPICQAAAHSTDRAQPSARKKTKVEGMGMNQPCAEGARRKTKVEGGAPVGLGPSPVVKGKRKTVVICQDGNGEKSASNAKPRLVGFLTTFSPDPAGLYFEVREGRHVAGAGEHTNITIKNDKNISSEHAILLYRRGIFFLRDNLSTNGTFVNGKEITTDVRLKNYDEIRMGDTVLKLIIIEPSDPETS